MSESGSLSDQTRVFAQTLTDTVRAVTPTAAEFVSVLVGNRFTVDQNPATGIPLAVDGKPLLLLKVEYRCCFDSAGAYLAVDSSHFKVYSAGANEPLFRVDHVRDPQSTIPSSHLQLHAHRDAFAFVMARAGRNSPKGTTRASSGEVPRLSELHFPLGGHRFRPCLEDVLTMLINELGVDCPPDGLASLAAGRAEWRRQQVRASVRDCPAAAADVLRALGYSVTAPVEGEPDERRSRLEAI